MVGVHASSIQLNGAMNLDRLNKVPYSSIYSPLEASNSLDYYYDTVGYLLIYTRMDFSKDHNIVVKIELLVQLHFQEMSNSLNIYNKGMFLVGVDE
mmetsp:Transcript_19399/g.22472  ORF Transcript_19399/g.22472 Transcript_19399/m.22472 type:complete len:96 (-) Transcript_19399:1032-1319(-)